MPFLGRSGIFALSLAGVIDRDQSADIRISLFFPTPFSSTLANLGATGARALSFNNLHTGERLKLDFWVNGDYVPEALTAINQVLRDFRTGDVHVIEPKLLDLLTMLNTRLEREAAFDVISGYRSPATNAILHAEHPGVAAKSLHMQGMAIDISVADRPLEILHRTALALCAGGVGYYSQSEFVDVGHVRPW